MILTGHYPPVASVESLHELHVSLSVIAYTEHMPSKALTVYNRGAEVNVQAAFLQWSISSCMGYGTLRWTRCLHVLLPILKLRLFLQCSQLEATL